MKTRRYIGLLITLSASAHAQVAEVRLQEAWRAEYAAEDATGEHVVGLWHFNADEPTRDASGHGHDLRFDGVRTSAGGRFGSCLESFRGWPDEDVRHAALAPNDPSLTPKGAFSIELWIQPKPDLEGYPDAFLVDKKYVAHDDYQMVLGRASKDGRRRRRVSLGFGTDSETYHSDAARFDEGVWYHVAFVYDGAGAGRFYLNGVPFGGDERPGRKSISPGRHLLSIGDRIGSYYHGFPGYIDEVRICNGALRFAPASLDLVSARTVFVRMEQNATVRLALTNLRRTELAGAVLRASLGATPEAEFAVPTLAPGQRHTIEYALDTSLRPGEYRLRARVDLGDAQPDSCEESFPIIIAPRKPSHRMPVLMWGVYGAENVLKEMERLKRIGFT
ncbi:MAG: LamG-like jellyroll fold domain-containing protein, partial [Armatimonadota bacterium]